MNEIEKGEGSSPVRFVVLFNLIRQETAPQYNRVYTVTALSPFQKLKRLKRK